MTPEMMRKQDLLRCRRDTYFLMAEIKAKKIDAPDILRSLLETAKGYTRMLQWEEKHGTPQKWLTFHETEAKLRLLADSTKSI